MPVYNAARHLRTAIDSVLAQTFTDFELLIVDDGSTDDSRAIVASYADPRIRVIEHESNLGLSAALNRGIDEARGALVARQDADDASVPERLERQAAFMRDHPAVAIVGSLGRVIDEDGAFIGVVDRPLDTASIRWYDVWDNPFIHTAVMFRRDVVAGAGRFEPEFDPFSQDYALWSRVLPTHAGANLAERLIHYRISDTSITGAMNLPDQAATDRRRAAFAPILRRIVARNLRATFGDSAATDENVWLASGFVLGVPSDRVPAFLRLFFSLLARYQQPLDRETRRAMRPTIARQIDSFAYRVSATSRRTAVRIYATAVRRDPALAAALPWGRALALMIAGASGRGAVKRSAVFRRHAPHL